MQYNYAIDLLKKDLALIDKALSDTKAWEDYPEAFKERDKKRKQIKELIKLHYEQAKLQRKTD